MHVHEEGYLGEDLLVGHFLYLFMSFPEVPSSVFVSFGVLVGGTNSLASDGHNLTCGCCY